MFILSQFYLFLEIKTRLSIGSFYLCCPFRKPPELDYKFDTAEKKMKNSYIGNMPQSYKPIVRLLLFSVINQHIQRNNDGM